MVKVKVKYFLTLSQITRRMVEELEIEVPKLDYLIKKLEGKYGGDFSKEISSRSIVILINGRSIQYGINSYVELRDGDEIAFLYIINGG